MSTTPAQPISHTPSPLLPTLTALGEVPSPAPESDGEVETDQLAFTLESPSCPQLQLFETVFNTGKPLSCYCQDDPLWLLLAEVASPCTNCLKTPGKCTVLPNSPRYFARRCNQDLAYSRRFLELHGTPAHQSTWGIPLSAWREYDAALHARTSSTSTLLELNMLDEQDAVDADQQELQEFLVSQQNEAAVAAKRNRDRSPMPVAGPSCKKVRSNAPKKHSHRKSPVVETNPEPLRHVRLVVPPGQPVVASTSVPVHPRTSPSLMEVPNRDLPMQGPSNLVRLAAVAEGAGHDLLSSTMPPTPRPTLVPRTFTAHPYRAENQRLAARICLLESQLADSQRENSSLTSALRDTSHALESRQREVEQLRSSSREVLEHEVEYRRVLDQFLALDEALPGAPGGSLLECFQKVQEDLQDATRERNVAVEKLSTSTCKNSHLTTSLLHQQGVVDESNALATRQRRLVEELQEEVHRARGRAAFVDQMIKEYPDEGYYEVVLPPLSQLEGDLNKAREDLRRVATFAHRLYRLDPATVLHYHHRYIGAIIEAVVAFLHCGLDSDDLVVVVHNFRLALDYMQAARGVHGDLRGPLSHGVGTFPIRQRRSLPYSAQHVGFAPPPDNSLEPPFHRRMLALSTPLPHSDGAGMWDDIVPALPSLDQLTSDWEQLMLQYIHHITDTPLPGPDTPAPIPSSEMIVEPSLEAPVVPVSTPPAGSHLQVPLFLPEQESPTSPSPPPSSPTLPPLFGSVANLAIDLTGDDDELYETGEVHAGSVIEAGEMEAVTSERITKNEPL
ncbi:hypothetical protein EV359DRAFT_87297 [Lentinula novae-zelandiae]|nr:hypothetical protein EV359DRAFT_87297 [Lentinula novae-zelandiae]